MTKIRQENAMPIELAIVGAGGHAKVVADTLSKCEKYSFSVVDHSLTKVGNIIHGVPVTLLGDAISEDVFHIAVGINSVRNELYERYKRSSRLVSIISSDAYIAHNVNISEGVFVAPKVVISAEAEIGLGTIVNHGAIIEHDCEIGDFCHIAPGGVLLGGVKLGNRVFVGARATILPGVNVADDVIIGAGAVVLSDIPNRCIVAGVPAKQI